jgi:hypothetical protein
MKYRRLVPGRERTISTAMIRRLLHVHETSSLHPRVLLEIECDLLALLPPLVPVMSASRRRRRGRERGRRPAKSKRRSQTEAPATRAYSSQTRPTALRDSVGSAEGPRSPFERVHEPASRETTACFGPTMASIVCYDQRVSRRDLGGSPMGRREDQTPKGSRT